MPGAGAPTVPQPCPAELLPCYQHSPCSGPSLRRGRSLCDDTTESVSVSLSKFSRLPPVLGLQQVKGTNMSNREQLKQALSASVVASISLQPPAVSLRDKSRGGGEQEQHICECRARDRGKLCQLFASFPALFSACPCLLNNAAPLRICSQPHPPTL